MEENRFMRVDDVAKELVVSGRVNRAFFMKKFCYKEEEEM